MKTKDKPKRMNMYASVRPATNDFDFRAKARLNLSIARDLSSSFGGKEADYLKRLNRKLKKEIHLSHQKYHTHPIGNSLDGPPKKLQGEKHG